MKEPDKKFMVKETECEASWEVKSLQGVAYTIQCRICKVIICSGGTPKCLKTN
jgi:hypothetical protein